MESKHSAFFTGGRIEWHSNLIYCQTKASINLLNIDDGCVLRKIGEEDSDTADLIQTFTTDGKRLISSHKSGLLKLWNENGELEKMWKYIHKGPISCLTLNDHLLASGGSDSSIRLWNLTHQSCLLNLRGCEGVINVVKFHPEEEFILGSGDDGKIHSWDIKTGSLTTTYDAHYSKVTCLEFSNDKKYFVTSGRDKVIILWEFGSKTAIKTIAVYESIESIVILPEKFKLPNFKSINGEIYVASGGENGNIRCWDVKNTKEIYVQTNSLINKTDGLAITQLIYNDDLKAILVASYEQNLLIYHLKSFSCLKQFVGFTDEILDCIFVGENDSHIAIATNSPDIKLYDNKMNCRLLKGHEDIVLALNKSKTDPNLICSSSKDNSIRLWRLDGDLMCCLCTGQLHTASVGSICFSQTTNDFIVSVSQDQCIKLWQITMKPVELNCKFTEIAHQKDINNVTVSPNDKIIATASQDKTIKLFTDSLTLVATLRGHKRGVWCVRFSPIDQVLASSSADCTLKLWSINDFTCLKTFEGHDSSVLRVEFLSNGMQLLSCGADGLIKLFSIKTSECNATMDEHDGRIWALDVKSDESCFITGGSDSMLIKWKDMTDELKLQRQKDAETMALEEQALNNCIHNGELLKALKLALKLDKPLHVLRLINEVVKKKEVGGLMDVVKELRNDQKESLLKCATIWNMNSKNCHAAQIVLNILLNQVHSGEFKPIGLNGTIEGILPYTERHFKRLTDLMQDLHFINYTINCMQPHSKNL